MTAPAPRPDILRLGWIDSARGLSLWAMFGFHLTWDLAYFGWIDHGIPHTAGFHWLGQAIGASFLMLVGISLALARQTRGPLLRSPAFWRRWAMIIAAAAAISLSSFWLFPATPIFFGILHCIALASLVAAPLVAAPAWVLLAAGALALAAPHILAAPFFDAKIFWWTGLGTFEPPSNDFRPLFPWLAFVLFGLALGQWIARRAQGEAPPARGPVSRALALCGRHSLAFYLIHQPLLFGFFSLLALFVVAPARETGFIGQCFAQCFEDTHEAELCQKTCVCTVAHAKADGYWPRMARDDLTPAQKTQAHDAIMACFGDNRD
ncbi:heparan-alpha-glucosaminide N-acetyltransferase [Rhodoblastus sp.]|uniref:heparan-alpha-glucosaminide N-acetyltransferase n=1 Tax=Rhodoblastus sp. TaxID=1962975 RepID=UPI0025DEA7D2|nr:heparan-alpha-glucosaminide N-acetyltransferase [Rhodoblastus sp.]